MLHDHHDDELKPPYVSVEAYYELCHADKRANVYFKLLPDEQVRVMHNLLEKVEIKLGGGDQTNGRKLIAKWATPTEIELLDVGGRPHLTEKIASKYLADRVEEVQQLYGARPMITAAKAQPCPNCVPLGDLHISVRGVYPKVAGKAMTVDSDTSKGKRIVARVGIRMRVTTEMHPLAHKSSAPGHDHAKDAAKPSERLSAMDLRARGSAKKSTGRDAPAERHVHRTKRKSKPRK